MNSPKPYINKLNMNWKILSFNFSYVWILQFYRNAEAKLLIGFLSLAYQVNIKLNSPFLKYISMIFFWQKQTVSPPRQPRYRIFPCLQRGPWAPVLSIPKHQPLRNTDLNSSLIILNNLPVIQWNHTLMYPLNLASFTLHNAFEIHPYFLCQ